MTTASTPTLTKESVLSLEPQVHMVDSDNNVQLFCYTNCSDSDTALLKQCRGVVFENDTLVLKTFPYTPEYTIADQEQLAQCIPDLEKCRIFDSYEGVLLRCFHAQGKWYLSTHRRLDAFRSKWASRTSFGETFVSSLEHYHAELLSTGTGETTLDKFFSFLDTSRQYVFLLENSAENRIVCIAREVPMIFHLGTFIDHECALDDEIGLPKPVERSATCLRELLSQVETLNEAEVQGVILFTPQGQVKILNSRYDYYFKLRGNEPSVKFRYLQVRMDYDKRDAFMTLYAEHRQTFERYEDTLYEITLHIKNAYIKRFIKKEFVTMPPEEYSIIKACHSWHIEDRDNHHISFSKVIELMNEQPPPKLNRMIRRYLNDEKTRAEMPSTENRLLQPQSTPQ